MEHSPRFGSPSAAPNFTDSPGARGFSPVVDDSPRPSASASPDKPASTAQDEGAETEFVRPTLPHHTRSDSQSKSKLDLDAVWSTLRPAPASASPEKEGSKEEGEQPAKEKEEDDMDTESDGGSAEEKKTDAEKEEITEEYDPFATEGSKKGNADDEFDALMGGGDGSQGEQEGPSATTLAASGLATTSTVVKPKDGIANLPSVWEGQINIPDEGSFTARLVQVGGTPFGPHPSIWDRILPKGKIEISGRIDEKAASEYVVQSNFSPSRENVILAILPHSTQPAELEKAEASYAKLLKFYSEKKRYGVAPPSGDLKKVAKDHYIVPLKQDQALPDYVELLDSHVLPEKGLRPRDYLLSVLVLQKGLGLNTTHRTKSGGSTPQSSQEASSSSSIQHNQLYLPPQAPAPHLSPLGQSGLSQPPTFPSSMSPPYAPPGVPTQASIPRQAASGPALDPAALQSLLSNPSLLQALNAGAIPQGSPQPPPVSSYGAFSPPPPGPVATGPGGFAGGIPGLGPVPQGTPAWGGPPGQSSSQPYGGFPPPPPPPGQWNPSGSPPWQGQQHQGPPGPAGPWSAGPIPHPPGYIDPERIKAASAEARRIAERLEQEKSRRSEGGYDYSRPNKGGRGGGGGPGRDRNYGNGNGAGFDDRNNSGNGWGRGGRNGGGNGGPAGKKSDNGMNQMQAGIQDRGWGRRG